MENQLVVQEKRGALMLKNVSTYGLGAAVAAILLAPTANAAGYTLDVTDVVSTVSGGVAVVSSIGLAVLSLVVVVKLFKWARSAL